MIKFEDLTPEQTKALREELFKAKQEEEKKQEEEQKKIDVINEENAEKRQREFNQALKLKTEEYNNMDEENQAKEWDNLAKAVNEKYSPQVKKILLNKAESIEQRAKTNVLDVSTIASEIIPSLNSFIVMQVVNSFTFSYPETLLLFNSYNSPQTIPTGTFEEFFKDFNELESELNNDGGTTSARSAFSDVVISDYNAKIYSIFNRILTTPDKWSIKYKFINSALNDFAKSQPIFNLIINDYIYYVTSSLNIYLPQYAIQTIDKKILNFDKITTLGKKSELLDPTNVVETATDFIQDLKNLFYNISYPSRGWKDTANRPTDATKNLVYTARGKKFILFILPELKSAIETRLLPNAYNPTKLSLPSEIVQVVPVPFEKWNDIYKWTTTDYLPENILGMLYQTDAIKTLIHYDINKVTDTPKAHTIFNGYHKLGRYLNYNSYNNLIVATPEDPPALKEVSTKQESKPKKEVSTKQESKPKEKTEQPIKYLIKSKATLDNGKA